MINTNYKIDTSLNSGVQCRGQIWEKHTTDNMSASGFLGLQFHKAYRKWQVDKKVLWKNIKIKEL